MNTSLLAKYLIPVNTHIAILTYSDLSTSYVIDTNINRAVDE